MIAASLGEIAEMVRRRAQRQGSIVPREIRAELTHAGLDEHLWKDVLALAGPALHYRRGRYYYHPPVSSRVQQEQARQRDIRQIIRQLIQQHRDTTAQVERREQDRADFVQQIQVRTEDDRTFGVLSRDLSPTGIRLISSRHFLGHKLRVYLPGTEGEGPNVLTVRILWTCAVGDELYENGGTFIDLESPPSAL
jgi:hypothetical protein